MANALNVERKLLVTVRNGIWDTHYWVGFVFLFVSFGGRGLFVLCVCLLSYVPVMPSRRNLERKIFKNIHIKQEKVRPFLCIEAEISYTEELRKHPSKT